MAPIGDRRGETDPLAGLEAGESQNLWSVLHFSISSEASLLNFIHRFTFLLVIRSNLLPVLCLMGWLLAQLPFLLNNIRF